ncbi:hypothetical protein HELRODRAFT_69402 [Helobdella robusta]|uniref:PRELI/MSF1 domain-containing protein n=1 Tax=Helobdella robusta TaxID=6412 RepID=T1FZU8_HELRO|nr:hypothetical protein HELRODRAFT_69402 [Helobdella robusta]ESN93084.1 hypothetical protein HELRODRAFT_69402 [Helobdella robusta]
MKIWTSEHTFKHPWETVVQAAWQKYPNPMNPSVVGIDTVECSVEKPGKLLMHRILSTEWGWPNWVTSLIGFNGACYVSEHSEVDLSNKLMKLESRNITLSNLVTIDERITYIPHSTDPNSTVLKSESYVTVKGVPMTSYLEDTIKKTMSSKAGQGRQAIEWVISKFKEETYDLKRKTREEFDGMTRFSSL